MNENKINELIENGFSTRAIAKELGISQGRVIRTLNRLGLETKPKRDDSGRRSWTIEQLKKAVASNESLSAVMRSLGLKDYGGNRTTVKNKILEHGFNTDHWVPHGGGKKVQRPLEDILKIDSTFQSSHLKKRLVSEGLFEDICAWCGLGTEWMGKPITLQLDHINGIHNDNRLENLRILCPNCHSQTDTWGNKNR